MNEVIIKESKKKAISLIIFGSVFLIVSIYITIGGLTEGNLFFIILGGISTVILGLILNYIIRNTINSIPLLKIEANGINDMSTLSSVGFIGWNEIQSISVQKRSGHEFIAITVFDINKLMKRISPAKQIAMKVSLIFKYPPIAISLAGAETDINEVVLIIKRRLEEYRIFQ